MYQTGGTIAQALARIEKHQYVLPAIQREFVWSPEQICRFFDSIMQGYPFGTFLFWKVEPQNSELYKFYDFVREYHQRDNPHCPELGLMPNQTLTAILDGQQRLTAFNIGLRGSLALKEPNKWWNNPNAFPKKYLYLDLLAESGDEEQGNAYDFRFLTKGDADMKRDLGLGGFWFKVGDILSMPGGPDMLDWLQQSGLEGNKLSNAYHILDRLHRVVQTEQCIAYYEEDNQRLERVLNIFIRMNSGGTVLSYSDLLLSIAVAQWSNRDARKEIHTLVDELNEVGSHFAFSQDFVLKAGLMLADIGSVGFKVENFNHENMRKLEEAWDNVRRALVFTVHLVQSFGFNGQTIRADSALLPIAYYLYKKHVPDNYLTHSKHQEDREVIRGWLIRSLLKASGIWGSGLDTLLTALRSTMQSHGFENFPAEGLRQAMARRGKSLTFEDEEIEELVDVQYSDRRLFALLSLLYPFVDLRNQFHIDHIFPLKRFTPTSLRRAGIRDENFDRFRDLSNRLANLQLLEGPFNNEKRAKLPQEWLQQRFHSREAQQDYCSRHDLGDIPTEITDFENFIEQRRYLLREKISKLLSPTKAAS